MTSEQTINDPVLKTPVSEIRDLVKTKLQQISRGKTDYFLIQNQVRVPDYCPICTLLTTSIYQPLSFIDQFTALILTVDPSCGILACSKPHAQAEIERHPERIEQVLRRLRIRRRKAN